MIHGIPPCLIPEEMRIYRVPLASGRDVYMRVEHADGYRPVIVQTDRFLSVWANTPYFDDPPFEVGVPYASRPEIWERDRRLNEGWAEEGFSHGISNPVPLAVVDKFAVGKLHLINGVTRTLWLLVHKAWAFPLYCPDIYVEELFKAAGIETQQIS